MAPAAVIDALKLTSRTKLAICGRLEGSGSAHAAALEKLDVRAKLYAVISALSFESSVQLTKQEELTLTAAKKYVPLATGEAWRDAVDDFAAEGLEPLDADMAKLSRRLEADEVIAGSVMSAQDTLAADMEAMEAVDDAEDLKRVRVLRDGPMYGVPKQKRGTSLFRARIEAKARIAGMVAASKVGFQGPVPSPAEYADATVQAASEAMLEAGADPAVHGFTLRHVPQALSTLSSAAGIDPCQINPFLASAGIGLTAGGKKLDASTKLNVSVKAGSRHPKLDIKALDKEPTRRISPAELRRLCIEYQESLPA